MTALSEDEIRAALEDLPGWRFDDGELHKQYRFEAFRDAIAFIGRIADLAEEANHHPDLENSYTRVRVGLQTWSEGAVTEKDVRLAREIESVLDPGS